MEWIETIDRSLLLGINLNHCAFCDFVFFWTSSKAVSIPLYVMAAWLLVRKFNMTFLKLALAAGLLILLSDQLSVLLKDTVMRYRPCYNLELLGVIRTIDGCGGTFGFVSSHAANTMSMALLFSWVAGKGRARLLKFILGVFVVAVGYSRIYLGRHYPADVVGGWLLGAVLAWLVYRLYKKTPGPLIEPVP